MRSCTEGQRVAFHLNGSSMSVKILGEEQTRLTSTGKEVIPGRHEAAMESWGQLMK